MSAVTLGVVGKSEKLSLLQIEDKIPLDRIENVLAIGIAGAHRIRDLMEQEIRAHAEKEWLMHLNNRLYTNYLHSINNYYIYNDNTLTDITLANQISIYIKSEIV